MRSWTGDRLLQTIEKLDPALCRTAPGFSEPNAKNLPGPIGQPADEPAPRITAQLLLEPVGTQLRMALELDCAAIIQFAGLLADSARGAGSDQRRTPIAIQLVGSEQKAAVPQSQGGPARGTDCEAATPSG